MPRAFSFLPLIASLLITAPIGGQPAAPEVKPRPLATGRLPTLQSVLDAARDQTQAPGLSATVILPDGSIHTVVSGVARRDPAEPMTAAARMPAGSTGKTFCAALTLLLVNENKLELDTPIAAYIGGRPWFSRLPNHDAITLRQLLSHSSGIREHVMSSEFTRAIAADPDKHWSPEELIAFALDQEPLFRAGDGFGYADTNFILAAIVVEAVTKRPFYEQAVERLTTPLMLSNTIPQDRSDLGIISGYTSPRSPFPVPEEVASGGRYAINPQFEFTGGGWVSTPTDLARWMRALLTSDLLPQQLREEMQKGIPAPRLGATDCYGLGLQIYTSPHGPAIGHTGFFPGYNTIVMHFPEKNITVALQANTDTPRVGKSLRPTIHELVEAVLPRTPAASPTPDRSTP